MIGRPWSSVARRIPYKGRAQVERGSCGERNANARNTRPRTHTVVRDIVATGIPVAERRRYASILGRGTSTTIKHTRNHASLAVRVRVLSISLAPEALSHRISCRIRLYARRVPKTASRSAPFADSVSYFILVIFIFTVPGEQRNTARIHERIPASG